MAASGVAGTSLAELSGSAERRMDALLEAEHFCQAASATAKVWLPVRDSPFRKLRGANLRSPTVSTMQPRLPALRLRGAVIRRLEALAPRLQGTIHLSSHGLHAGSFQRDDVTPEEIASWFGAASISRRHVGVPAERLDDLVGSQQVLCRIIGRHTVRACGRATASGPG
jgi:hypothetical protein